MIPLKDDLPTRRFPWVTVTLIVVNTVVFGYMLWYGATGHDLNQWVYLHGFVPKRFLAAPFSPAEWASVFTAMFMHANFLHIGGNMLYLWIFGNNIEDRLGPLRYIAFYLTAGLAAFGAQTLAGPAVAVPNLGASGAIAGVLGAYILLFPKSDVLTIIPPDLLLHRARQDTRLHRHRLLVPAAAGVRHPVPDHHLDPAGRCGLLRACRGVRGRDASGLAAARASQTTEDAVHGVGVKQLTG